MGNCANVTVGNPLTVAEYYNMVQEAVSATYGDALKLDFDPANTDIDQSGIGVSTDEGHFLCQFFQYEPTRIVVDHRRGEVGYMVSDVLMRYMALKLGGAWTEDCLEEPLDSGPDRPLYFLDYMRRTHARVIEAKGWEIIREYTNDLRELFFTGKFARFWSRE